MKSRFVHSLIPMLLILLSMSAYGQKRKVWNLPDFDRKKIHFGFSLCLNSMSYIMHQDLTRNDSLVKLETNSQSGFNINAVAVLHLNKNFSLRFLPGLSFGQRNLEYTFDTQPRKTVVVRDVESTYMDLPLSIKYRSNRLNNFAAYVVTGGRYSLDLASEYDTKNDVPIDQQLIRLDRHNFWYEVGFGLDFFLEYFKFSPEIKLSVGANDVLIKDGSFWVEPIDQIKPRMVTISFHFEG